MSRIFQLSLNNLSDTVLSGIAENQILQVNASGLWENRNSLTLSAADAKIDLSGISVSAVADTILKTSVNTMEAGVIKSGILGGTSFDHRIYASVADLATDSAFILGISGEGTRRLQICHSGLMEWGPGDGVLDTNLYRSSLNVLKTDGGFIAGALITGNAGFLDPSDSTAAAPGMALGDSGDSGLYVTTDDEEMGLTIQGVSILEYDSFLTGTWTMYFSDDWLQFTKGRIISSTGAISFGNENISSTGFWAIGETPSANERLNILMSATDTKGINIDGATNPYDFSGGAVDGFNNISRTINGSGTPATASGMKLTTLWDADLSGTGANYANKFIDNIFGTYTISGDLTTSGVFVGGNKTIDLSAARFNTNFTGNLTSNNTGVGTWNPRFISFEASSTFAPSSMTSTDGNALYQSIGGTFSAEAGAGAITNSHTLDTQTLEFIGGTFSATGQSAISDLPTTSYGGRFSAISSDTNIAIQTDAGDVVHKGGDTYWVGAGTGLPYGEAQQTDEATFNVTMTTVNVWVEVDAATTNITAPELNLVTFPDDHYLLCEKAGRYLITYSFTAEINSVAGGDQHVESGIMVNDTIQTDKGIGHEQYAAINKERNLQGHTIIDVPTNGQVSLAIKNTTSSGKILTIDHLNITVTQVGGR